MVGRLPTGTAAVTASGGADPCGADSVPAKPLSRPAQKHGHRIPDRPRPLGLL